MSVSGLGDGWRGHLSAGLLHDGEEFSGVLHDDFWLIGFEGVGLD